MIDTQACSTWTLPPLGLGSWAFGGGYDWGPLDEPQAQRAVLCAWEQGITLIDTAPIYGDGQSELFLGRVLAPLRARVRIATKCGLVKQGSWPVHELHPKTLTKQLEDSLKRLQTDYIDLYQIHYPDPQIPLEDAVGELTRFQQAGKIRQIGLCNVTPQQIRTAAAVTPIFSVQNQYSLLRPAGQDVLQTCEALGIGFIGYGVLGGGILSGKYKREPNLRRADARNYFYKCYRGEAFWHAQQTAARVQQVAQQKGVAASAVALAWALHKRGVNTVLFGARNPSQVQQNACALHVMLTEDEISFLGGASCL